MYCEKCKVTVDGELNICPLCHNRLVGDEIVSKSQPFAGNAIKKRNPMKTFQKVYIFLAVNVLVVSIVINALTTPEFWWSIAVAGALLYIYELVRRTILSNDNPAIKILRQAIAISIICIIIEYVFRLEPFAFSYAIPLIMALSSITLGIFALVRTQESREYLIHFVGLSILGVIPLIVNSIIEDDINWPSIVSALISGVILTSLVCFSFKKLVAELKKIFHI